MQLGGWTSALRLIAANPAAFERHNRSGNDLPKRLILVGELARLVVAAHVPGFDLPACPRAFAFFASPDLLLSGLLLSDLTLSDLALSDLLFLLLSALPSDLSDLP